ncbi:MAG: class I SAM-dependent methyltransferase [Bacteroidota bacterium]|nr:class I SAM-dependent methyltransferase [Bacteroidota bacterium]
MKRTLIKINAFIKGLVLLSRPHFFLSWMERPLLTISNTLSLTKWIAKQNKNNILNDFYSVKRDYSKRYLLYQYIIDTLHLKNDAIDYLEFGVYGGYSFNWWLENCQNTSSKFYGFDTFEGLPENWGTFMKGDLASNIPEVHDTRVTFLKGLFQDTVPNFLSETNLNNGKRKIIHLDADLFSSTLFALTSLAPYLKNGDILLFDEFNVPNHEFFAFKVFSESYYIKTELLAAMNNYFHVALIIIK